MHDYFDPMQTTMARALMNIRDDTLLTSNEERMTEMIKFIGLKPRSHSAVYYIA